jgi:hypothetical protein
VLFSAVPAAGVRVIGTVTVWPTGTITEVSPPTVTPAEPLALSATVSCWFPVFCNVTAALVGVPGVLLTCGVLLIVRASSAGMVNCPSDCCTSAGLPLLVAVTVNE